jgi:DNA-binding LytR/AlgR family response regulator
MQVPFFVRYNRVLKRIDPSEVICLFTEGNYTKIFLTNDRTYMVRSTLSDALEKLPKDTFIQINRSAGVSIYFIDDIKRNDLVVGGLSMPITKKYIKSTMAKLNIIE